MVSKVCTHEVLLQGADEALRDAIALRLADEGGRALDAEEADLVLEVAGQVVGAMVVAQGETLGRVLLDAAEVAQDALAHRLERLEAVAGAGGMAADALAGAVVDGNEDPGPAVSECPFAKSWGRQSPTIGMSEAMDHQADHGEGDHHLGDLWQHLVVFGEASPPSKPTE